MDVVESPTVALAQFVGPAVFVHAHGDVAMHEGTFAAGQVLPCHVHAAPVISLVLEGAGQEEVGALFRRLAATFSDCTHFSYELVAADVVGDLAYTVGYEHTRVSVDGEPRDYRLRVTQVYRREEGQWRVAHRHGDTSASDDSP